MKYSHYLKLSYHQALQSVDESTQLGAVITNNGAIAAKGHNGPTLGMRPDEQNKLFYYEHAERAAIYSAGSQCKNGVIYCSWASCADCARAIILSGIKHVVRHKQRMMLPNRWQESIDAGNLMFKHAGVRVTDYDGPIDAAPVLHSGRIWNPATFTWE